MIFPFGSHQSCSIHLMGDEISGALADVARSAADAGGSWERERREVFRRPPAGFLRRKKSDGEGR